MENMHTDVWDCKGLNVVRASVVITEQMYGKMESICKRQQQACFAASLLNIIISAELSPCCFYQITYKVPVCSFS